MARLLRTFGGPVVAATVTTTSVGFVFMLLNEYVASAPDLTGWWKFIVACEQTTIAQCEGLNVTYQVLLIRKGLE